MHTHISALTALHLRYLLNSHIILLDFHRKETGDYVSFKQDCYSSTVNLGCSTCIEYIRNTTCFIMIGVRFKSPCAKPTLFCYPFLSLSFQYIFNFSQTAYVLHVSISTFTKAIAVYGVPLLYMCNSVA